MDMQEGQEVQAPEWLYSFTESGWFSPKYNMAIPEDAVPVADDLVQVLKDGLAAGQILVAGEHGEPVLADPPPPSDEVLAAIERAWRDVQLVRTDSLVTRHRDELELGQPTTLEQSEYQALQLYRAKLRQWPDSAAFPSSHQRPVAPAWLLGLEGSA